MSPGSCPQASHPRQPSSASQPHQGGQHPHPQIDIKPNCEGAVSPARSINGNTRSARRPQHGYVIKRNGKVHKYGISGGKVRKDGKSYRAEKQVRQLKNDNPNARWESDIISNEPNRARILDWEKGMVDNFAANHPKGQGPRGNILPQPSN